MPELRKDPSMGRWVIIATERARRPGNLVGSEGDNIQEEACLFCAGLESKTPSEIYSIREKGSSPNTSGWQVRVITSEDPFFRIKNTLNRHGHGIYDVMEGIGAHEIVIETPDHVANMADLNVEQITKVVETYRIRMNDLSQDKRFRYVLAAKNYGWSAGSDRIKHTRSEIIATPINPLRVKEKLATAKKYYDYHDRCLYCDLIHQEQSAPKRLVAENEHFVALTPFASRFPFEIWILPKKHCCDFTKGVEGLEAGLAKMLKEVLLRLKIGVNDPAYNFAIHTAPVRRHSPKTKYSTIEEDYHWHIEVLPRLTYVAGFEKGAGFYICPIPPEDTAEFLREVEI